MDWFSTATAEHKPLPLAWWHTYYRVGGRSAAVKQNRLARDVAELAARPYIERIKPALDIDEVLDDGVEVVSVMSVWPALYEHHLEGLDAGLSLLPASDAKRWVMSNTAGVLDLVSWRLAWAFCATVFGRSLLRFNLPDEPPRIAPIREPDRQALGWANVCSRFLMGDRYLLGVRGHMQATVIGVRAVQEEWPAPPFWFDTP